MQGPCVLCVCYRYSSGDSGPLIGKRFARRPAAHCFELLLEVGHPQLSLVRGEYEG